MADCVFCKIAAGEIPAHVVWEDENYMAILTRWPSTPGFTVLFPKAHHPSDINELPEDVEIGLMRARRAVSKKLMAAFKNVGRVAFIGEGYGIDHAHIKLIPLHGTPKNSKWRRIVAKVRMWCQKYQGFIISSDGEKEWSDRRLATLAAKIRAAIST